MATTLALPALGNSMEEGTILRWFKTEGEAVAKGESLYEVMTDKVAMEVEAPEAGTLRQILAPVESVVPVGDPVAVLDGLGEQAETGTVSAGLLPHQSRFATGDAPPSAFSSVPDTAARVLASPRARRAADERGLDLAQLAGRGTGVDGRIVEADVLVLAAEAPEIAAETPEIAAETPEKAAPRVSPLARQVAAVHGVAPETVPGTGHGGKVTQGDVRRSMAPAPPAPEGQTTVPLRGMRKMVAEAVARSARTAPQVTLTLAVDMTEATRLRAQLLTSVEKTHGVRLSFTDIVAKAAARALRDHPYLNSTLADDIITLHRAVHLGVAVSLGTDGLVVPVVHDAQVKSLGEFSAALKALAVKAKSGTLASEDMAGGTFTLTNLGPYGITQFDPILVPPQAAILGVCAITDTVVAVGGQPAVRPVMPLCLTFDHRIVDGAPAAAFLAQLKETLEQPYLMFA